MGSKLGWTSTGEVSPVRQGQNLKRGDKAVLSSWLTLVSLWHGGDTHWPWCEFRSQGADRKRTAVTCDVKRDDSSVRPMNLSLCRLIFAFIVRGQAEHLRTVSSVDADLVEKSRWTWILRFPHSTIGRRDLGRSSCSRFNSVDRRNRADFWFPREFQVNPIDRSGNERGLSRSWVLSLDRGNVDFTETME